jgi:excisionase family DNA binding protein
MSSDLDRYQRNDIEADQRGGVAVQLPEPTELITFRSAGALLGVTHPTIRRWITEQRLSEYRIASSPRVDRREVLGLICLISAAQAVTR